MKIYKKIILINMDLKNIFLTTFIPEFPKIYNYNNNVFKRYLDVIYNETQGVVIVPINTPGRVKAATGEFVTTITDNLIVKKQWTNLYSNVNTVDQDYYNTYISGDASVRDASTIGTLENSTYKYVDVLKPYYKISNTIKYAFKSNLLGQEIQLILDTSTGSTNDYEILLDPSTNSGTISTLTTPHSDPNITWIKLIAINYDSSWGTKWIVKQYGGPLTIS